MPVDNAQVDLQLRYLYKPLTTAIWGYGATGSATALQAEGCGFDSHYFHQLIYYAPKHPDTDFFEVIGNYP